MVEMKICRRCQGLGQRKKDQVHFPSLCLVTFAESFAETSRVWGLDVADQLIQFGTQGA